MAAVREKIISLLEEHQDDKDFAQTVDFLDVVIEGLKLEKNQPTQLTGHSVDPDGTIGLRDVDFHNKENTRKHHTNKFAITKTDNGNLVVRRGSEFKVSFLLDRNPESKDVLVLRLTTGKEPRSDNLTQIDLEIPSEIGATSKSNGWTITLVYAKKSTLTVAIISPPNSIVGYYGLSFISANKESKANDSSAIKNGIYLLFNPWIPEDDVYMDDPKLLEEYVLSDFGKVYQGTQETPNGKKWYFGQFEELVLPVITYLFELGGVTPVEDLASPVLTARHISALVDSNDEGGILEGRWTGEYSDGTSPIVWSSTPTILESFMRQGGVTVKYGQCWVYASVVTTLCRAIGIPCRPITNFESAHDVDGNLEMDIYVDENKNPLKSDDSVWNFHLWNEVWMRRPDLGKKYDGWQAMDGTPQLVSEGRYQVGPCPLAAIREKQVDIKYDTGFVYAEANAIFNIWQKDPAAPGGFKKTIDPTRKSGVLVLTKKPGIMDDNEYSVDDAEDITANYKSLKLSGHSEETPDDQEIVAKISESEKPTVGAPFDVIIKFENRTAETRDITFKLAIGSLNYNGEVGKTIKFIKNTQTVEAQSTAEYVCTIQVSEYTAKLSEFSVIKAAAAITDANTKKVWIIQKSFQLRMPSLNMSFEPSQVGKKLLYTISFINPLPIPLTGGSLNLEIPGMIANTLIADNATVEANGEFRYTGKLIVKHGGKLNAMASFSSSELPTVTGSQTLQI